MTNFKRGDFVAMNTDRFNFTKHMKRGTLGLVLSDDQYRNGYFMIHMGGSERPIHKKDLRELTTLEKFIVFFVVIGRKIIQKIKGLF